MQEGKDKRKLEMTKSIKSEGEYSRALDRLNEIFHAPSGTEKSDEADILVLLVDDYENKRFPIEPPASN